MAQIRSARPCADGRGPAGLRSADSASRRSATDGARPSRCQNTRSITSDAAATAIGPGSGTPGAGGIRRSISGAASKTKNRTCGFSVEPMSDLAFSRPMMPRSRVKPLPPISYTSTDGFFTRRPVPFAVGTATGPVPVRRPEGSGGVNDVSGTTPAGPTSSACPHAGCTSSGAFDPASCTTSHSVVARDISMSNGLDADERPATARLYRLTGSGGNSPSIRRAPRASRRVYISPLTSSSAWSVDASAARVEWI